MRNESADIQQAGEYAPVDRSAHQTLPAHYARTMPLKDEPTQGMYAAIGRTASQSSRIDNYLRELLEYLIQSPFASVIGAGETNSQLVTLCRRTAKYNHTLTNEQFGELMEVLKVVETVQPDRNFLVHSQWSKVDGAGMHIGAQSTRPGPRLEGRGTSESFKISVREAQAIADGFSQVGDLLEVFIRRTFPRSIKHPLLTRPQQQNLNEMFAPFFSPERDTGLEQPSFNIAGEERKP